MSVATVLLVRFQGGYLEVPDVAAVTAWGRKEGFLQLGSVFEENEATRIAQAVLSFQNAPRVATTLGVEPTGTGDAPYVDYVVGDTITAPEADGTSTEQRVVSLTVVEDDNGEVSFANELKATFLVQEEAFDRQLKKQLDGSMSGQSVSSNPIPTGTTTRAQNGDSIGALREYVNKQLLDRLVAAQETANSNTQTGGTWTPGVTQLKFIAESRVVTTGSGGSTGRAVIAFPDGGFDNELLMVVATLGDVPGVGAAILNTVHSNTNKSQLDVVAVNNAGVGISAGSIRVDYWAVGW